MISTHLEQIVRHSRLESRPIPGNRIAVLAIVEDAGRRYKVRAYRSAATAERQSALLARGVPLLPVCRGRVERYLVLDYLEQDDTDMTHPSRSDIGRFLGQLAAVDVPAVTLDEFGGWCGAMVQKRMFLPQTIEFMCRYYERCLSRSIDWGLEYYVANPPNFVRTESGRLVCVDEKHLFRGPRGVGLIKPERSLTTDDFRELQTAYCERLQFDEFPWPDYHPFLVFYYGASLLAFFAENRGASANLDMPRVHWMRRALLEIAQVPSALRLREEAAWQVPFRLRRASRLVRRSANRALRSIHIPNASTL